MPLPNRDDPFRLQPFDRDAEVDISSRNLPHWFQASVAIFVTFRTSDSLPREVILRWQRELEEWLELRKLPLELASAIVDGECSLRDTMLEQLSAVQRSELKRLSDRLFHRSLDECHGACLLRRKELAKIVADAIRFFDGERYDLDSFVVMPNHVHAVVQFRPGFQLDVVSQSWLRYTAREINKITKESGAFWQPEPFDHLIRSGEQLSYLHRYIAENPSKAKLAAGEFLYWRRTA